MQSEKKQITFVVNPISGISSKKGFDRLVEKIISPEQFSWSIVRTEYAGHAAEIAAQCVKDGTDICVAVGGDGTVNEVARSLVGSSTALGIVPCGSGNGLARHLCIPMSMKGALAIINQGQTDFFDYGIMNDRPFFCTCGMGFDAYVSLKFAQSGHRGLSTYAKTVLKEGMKYNADVYDVVIEAPDGQTIHQSAFLIACANAAQYGNNTYIAPGASMQDGLLDVIIVEAVGNAARPKLLFDLFTRTIRSNRHVRTFQARKLHIHRSLEGAVHFDGDPIVMGTDIDIELRHAQLKAIVNPRSIEDHSRPNRMIDALNKMEASMRKGK